MPITTEKDFELTMSSIQESVLQLKDPHTTDREAVVKQLAPELKALYELLQRATLLPQELTPLFPANWELIIEARDLFNAAPSSEGQHILIPTACPIKTDTIVEYDGTLFVDYEDESASFNDELLSSPAAPPVEAKKTAPPTPIAQWHGKFTFSAGNSLKNAVATTDTNEPNGNNSATSLSQ